MRDARADGHRKLRARPLRDFLSELTLPLSHSPLARRPSGAAVPRRGVSPFRVVLPRRVRRLRPRLLLRHVDRDASRVRRRGPSRASLRAPQAFLRGRLARVPPPRRVRQRPHARPRRGVPARVPLPEARGVHRANARRGRGRGRRRPLRGGPSGEAPSGTPSSSSPLPSASFRRPPGSRTSRRPPPRGRRVRRRAPHGRGPGETPRRWPSVEEAKLVAHVAWGANPGAASRGAFPRASPTPSAERRTSSRRARRHRSTSTAEARVRRLRRRGAVGPRGEGFRVGRRAW